MSLTAASSLPLQVERIKKREPNDMSPIGKYFGGHGSEVMADMKKKNGEKAGEKEFYATANAKGQNPPDKPTKRKSIGQRMVERAGY